MSAIGSVWLFIKITKKPPLKAVGVLFGLLLHGCPQVAVGKKVKVVECLYVLHVLSNKKAPVLGACTESTLPILVSEEKVAVERCALHHKYCTTSISIAQALLCFVR